MKKLLASIAFLIFCTALLNAQSAAFVRRAEWSLSLKTGGAPWEKSFEVELSQAGNLAVSEHNPEKMPAETRSKLSRVIPAEDAQEIFEHALRAFREFRFPEERVERHDGTNLTLRLTAYDRALEMRFMRIGRPEEEIQAVAKVLSLINRHLPQEHQVY